MGAAHHRRPLTSESSRTVNTSLHPSDPYLSDTAPGRGARSAPRSWLRTDAPALCLDGDWAFRLSPTAAVSE
ncbi:hypothetical protein ASE16_10100, partial [Leifsonia sp. Root227]